jgi:large subunit ribosomal protein L5
MATPRLKKDYNDRIVPELKAKFSYKSIMQAPKITKIVLNQGLGDAVADKKLVDTGLEEMALIAGQKPVAAMSKNSISNF